MKTKHAADLIPPHDEEAERGFVGGLLRWSRYLDELEHPVPVESLYSHRMRLIYATMLDLREDSEPIDAITVADRLRETGRLDAAGDETELLQLLAENLTGAQTQHYAGIITDHWKRRLILAACEEAARDARRLDEPDDVSARLDAALCAVASKQADSQLFDGRDVLRDSIGHVVSMKSNGRTAIGLPTGFIDLDSMTSGLVPSEMFVIGARPSQGKTALAVNMLMHAANQASVLLVSIEMGREQIAQRILSSIANVNSIRVRHAKVTDEEIDRMKDAVARINGGNFWIADIPGATISEVVQVARQTKRKRPDLAVVAVDYMQLIRHENRRLPRHEQIAEISGRLKALARSLNVCVVALSQLNRQMETGKERRPEMHHLRDSGAVEQDADVIALLHRPEFADPQDRPGEADLIVCKVRNGSIGDVTLQFQKETTTFRNCAPRWVAPDERRGGDQF